MVSMAHGAEDRPHRIRAVFADAVLEVAATPLGEHPTDDWALTGPTTEHIAYRNHVRVTPLERSADAPALLERLQVWRAGYGWNEWRREDPGPR